MNERDLFGERVDAGSPVKPGGAAPDGPARLLTAERKQVRLVPTDLESLLPEDHPARAIWAVVCRLDLSGFEKRILSRGETAGRPAIDPKILVTLCVYAASQSVASAREVERLCGMHDAYRWICGGVHVCAHTISDFRVANKEVLDGLLTQVLATLLNNGLVELKRVTQDGLRVRASAGAASFRREPSLVRCQEEAKTHLEALEKESASDQTAAREAARHRAAFDRLQRIQKAIEELPRVRESKKPEDRAEARVSTTDPEARVMKMADGGFRPAYNVQIATDTASRIVTGVSVDNIGSDMGHINPMLDQIHQRTDRLPGEHLADGGYAQHADIQKADERGVTVYAPPPKPRERTCKKPRPEDPEAIARWRDRMATPEAKEIYKERASTAETVNANLRCLKGLDRLLVRTIPKVLCVALWSVLAYNIERLIALI